MVLQAVAKNYNNATSNQIFNSINYHNYAAFRVSLRQYVKRGYLKKCGDKKPYHYCLTKKGYLHAKDPFVLKKRREIRYWQHMSRILADDREFIHGVHKFIQYQPEIALHEICRSPYFANDNSFHGYYRRIIDQQDREIRDLHEFLNQLGVK